ncbi:MAG: type II toxin-antitoxin system VapC family toxin [Proteobacteria bacterium]|nr:type II toxin-antitoxin system VapC family toxin [Pseudomonadota bacterium]
MLAVDTNVVVRLLADDDPQQSPSARRLFQQHTIYLVKTVLLETEWVLRKTYACSRHEIHQRLLTLVSLPQVEVEQAHAVVHALAWFAQGMDFADALHLATSDDCDAFATFDRKLAAAAKKAKAGKVKAL